MRLSKRHIYNNLRRVYFIFFFYKLFETKKKKKEIKRSEKRKCLLRDLMSRGMPRTVYTNREYTHKSELAK